MDVAADGGPPKKEAARAATLRDAMLRKRLRALAADVALTYLLRECHAGTARALLAAAGARARPGGGREDAAAAAHFARVTGALAAGGFDARLAGRRRVREMVCAGRVADALAAADGLLGVPGGVAASCPTLHFDLCCQHFVELIRADRCAEACAYSAATLGTLAQKDPRFNHALESFLGLLAYPNPAECVLGYLMDPKRRGPLAARLSDALFVKELADLGGAAAAKAPGLEGAIRQLKAVTYRLREEGSPAAKRLDLEELGIGDGMHGVRKEAETVVEEIAEASMEAAVVSISEEG